MLESITSLFTPAILTYLLKGFGITLKVAAIAVILSILIGTIRLSDLAAGRIQAGPPSTPPREGTDLDHWQDPDYFHSPEL